MTVRWTSSEYEAFKAKHSKAIATPLPEPKPSKRIIRSGYNKKVVLKFFLEHGLPEPAFEYRFHLNRKWRFDLALVLHGIAIEVQGGIWIQGGHNRGAQMKRDWEKYNVAATLGWRILYFEPKDLCLTSTVELIKTCL